MNASKSNSEHNKPARKYTASGVTAVLVPKLFHSQRAFKYSVKQI